MSGGDSAGIVLKGAGYGIRMIFPEGGSEDVLLAELERLFSESSLLSGSLGVALDFQGRKFPYRKSCRTTSGPRE